MDLLPELRSDAVGLADEVRRRIGDRLAPRVTEDPSTDDPSGPPALLGAGDDDLDVGRHYLALLAETGVAVPTWPVEFGGLGLGPEAAGVVARTLAEFERPDLYPFGVGLALVGPILLAYGTSEQRARWLPAIRTGEEIWCQMFSEPDAGSDLAGLAARAERDGDRWRVTGQKVRCSRAQYATWGLLLARTDPEAPKHAGITAFAIRIDQPGVEVRPLRQMNGDAHFNEVFLDGAVVDDGDRIGEPGQGWAVAVTTLAHEREGLGGGGFGGAGLGADTGVRLLALARRCEPSAAQRDRVVRAWVGLEVARLTGARARDNARAGRSGREAAGMKIRLTDALKRAAETAVDLEGPAGVAGVGAWATMFLTVPSLSIRGGTDEIQRDIVGDRMLGLPREPRTDKALPFSQLPRSGR